MKKLTFIFLICLISFHIKAQLKTATVNIKEDTYISYVLNNSVFGNNNYSYVASLTLGAWTQSGSFKQQRVLLKFDLSSIPQGATISSANLYLYSDPQAITGNSTEASSNEGWIQRITEDWDVDSVTWNTQPLYRLTDSIVLPSDTIMGQRFLSSNSEVDVTEFVKYFHNNPQDNYGFMVSLNNETNPYCRKWFASSENSDSTVRPKVIIKYNDYTSIDSKIETRVNLLMDKSNLIINSKSNVLPQIKIVDSQGRLIEIINTNSNTITYNFQKKGVYLISFEYKDKPFIRKVFAY